jgi:hypothetical protein
MRGRQKNSSPAWAASSFFVERGEEDGGGPVTFGRSEQVESLGVKFDGTVVICR